MRINNIKSLMAGVFAALGMFVLISLSTAAYAVPANPAPKSFTQPDGAVIQIFLKGDEFLNWTEDVAGNLIVFDKARKAYFYADWTEEGPVSTGELAGLPDTRQNTKEWAKGRTKGRDIPATIFSRAKSAREAQNTMLQKGAERQREELRTLMQSKGILLPGHELLSAGAPITAPVSALKRNLVMIHVTWSDRTGINTPKVNGNHIYDLVFNPTTRSVNHYYKELFGSSEDIIIPATVITQMDSRPGVIEVTLPGQHMGQPAMFDIIVDALAAASAQGRINFSIFDTNGDGIIQSSELSIGMVIDGYEASAGGPAPNVWGSAWTFYTLSPTLTNGVQLQQAFLQGAFQRTTGNTENDMPSIGIICHEMGHSGYNLGDTYDYTYTSSGHGNWSLMASGSWASKSGDTKQGQTPCYVDAYNMVWSSLVAPGAVSESESNLTINTHLDIYRVNTRATNSQYFLLQQRKYGTADNYDRGAFWGIDQSSNANTGGLLIYHIDENVVGRWHDKSSHYKAGIIEAHGGTQHLSSNLNGGDLGDLWGVAKSTISDFTDPSTRLYSAFTNDSVPPSRTITSGIEISNISWNSSEGDTRFNVVFSTPAPYSVLSVSPFSIRFGTVSTPYDRPEAQTVTITNAGPGTATLEQPTATYYDIGTLSGSTLAPGTTATFTIRPKSGLNVGLCDESIAVKETNGVVAATVRARFAVTADTRQVSVSNFVQLKNAIEDATETSFISFSNTVIIVTADIIITERLIIYGRDGSTLTIRSENAANPATLTRGVGGFLISVGAVKLVLEDIIIDGDKNRTFEGDVESLLLVNGELILKDGAILRNNLTSFCYGAGVQVHTGYFHMLGGEISNNTAGNGFSGGGVSISGGGEFTMTGGKITNNTASAPFGSGVYFQNGTTFNLGGTAFIHGNTGDNVYIQNGNAFILSPITPPTSGMTVGVSTETPSGIIVNSGATAADATYFFADEVGKAVVYESGQLIVKVPASPVYRISASALGSFGTLATPYTQPAAQTVTITNTGTGSVTLTQPTSTNYDIGTLSRTTITQGQTATFTVCPKAGLAVGNYDATITINGTNGASTTVNASFTVTPALTYTLSASTLSSFGSLATPYTQPTAQTVTITNTGTASVTLTQPVSTNYEIGTLSRLTILPTETATFTVRPKAGLAPGSHNETITINGNGGASTTVSATFTVTFIDIVPTPPSVNFGSLPTPYTQPEAQTVSIQNEGTGTVTLIQPTATNYEIGTLSRTTLAQNETATFTVRPIAGLAVGNYDATITINGSGGASTLIHASFTVGEATTYIITSSSLSSFGTLQIPYTQPTAQTVTIINEGTGAITLTQPVSTNYEIGTLSRTVITQGQTATFTVRPKAGLGDGNHNETITINGDNGAYTTVHASFTVTYASIGASPNPSFGTLQIPYTQPVAQTVTITNTGTASVTLTQPVATNYDIGTLSRATIAPTETATFTVRPKAGLGDGNYNETITINGSGGASTTVSATFTVTPALTYTLSATPNPSFGSLQIPYTQPAAQTVTITNTGTGSVTLTQPVSTNYDIGTLSRTSIAPTETATFTVRPKAGLTAGNYPETITINGTNGASTTVSATFTVTPAPTYTIGATTLSSFGSLQIPYTQPAAQTVTITNTGTGSVTLTQPTATNYDIGTLSRTTIAQSETATFTVRPKAGLAAGNYPETITINGNNGASTTVSASFTVTPALPAGTITINTPPTALLTTETHTFQATITGLGNTAVTWTATAGTFNGSIYTAPATGQNVTITATSQQEPTLKATVTIKISSANFDGNTKTTPSLLGLANAYGSTNPADLALYDLNGDGRIDDEDIRVLFKGMEW